MTKERIDYVIPADGSIHGSRVDLVVTYDETAQNADGSYTVTDASGTYQTLDANGDIINTDTITGIAAPGGFGNNDNELFVVDDPTTSQIVDSYGLTYTIDNTADSNDGKGDINFFNTGVSSPQYTEYVRQENTASSISETPACYCTATLIRTDRGDVAVEHLAIGDRVMTASGVERPIKWIGHRSYSGRFARNNPDLLPIRFEAGALAESVPARALSVSPKHAMFIEGVLIPAEHLVNGVTVTEVSDVESLTYWHVELDSHDVLLAEGAPSESFVDDDSRGMFHNAHTFRQMYPDAVRAEAIYCAPRVEDGYALDSIRQRIAARAGIDLPRAQTFGKLHGTIDVCDGIVIQGWAQDAAYPDAPVCLDIVVDGVRVAMVYAERFRNDLGRAGVGDGHHAFDFTLPVPLSRDVPHIVEVRRSADGVLLAGSKSLAALPYASEAIAA